MFATTAVRWRVLAAVSVRSWRAVRGTRGTVRGTTRAAVRGTRRAAVRRSGVGCVRRLAAGGVRRSRAAGRATAGMRQLLVRR